MLCRSCGQPSTTGHRCNLVYGPLPTQAGSVIMTTPMPSYLGPADAATAPKLMPGKVVIGTWANPPVIDWRDRAEKAEALVAHMRKGLEFIASNWSADARVTAEIALGQDQPSVGHWPAPEETRSVCTDQEKKR